MISFKLPMGVAMIVNMLESIAVWIIHIISTLGYPGIVLTMAIESALIPLPSEVIMPFSGYLVSTGRFALLGVALAGAFGNTLGSLAAYGLGYWGHEKVVRRLVKKYGKFILFTEKELDKAEKFMHKYKNSTVLISRVLPGVRTVISLPAGIARIPLARFVSLTFLGSLIWSYVLAYIGFTLGRNWKSLGGLFHKFDAVIVLLVVLGLGYYIFKRLKEVKS